MCKLRWECEEMIVERVRNVPETSEIQLTISEEKKHNKRESETWYSSCFTRVFSSEIV